MMGYTHAAAGAVAGAAVGQMVGSPGLGAVVGALAALLPDIDHPGSVIGSRVRPVSVLMEFFSGHRTITHTIWFCLAVGLLAGFAGRMVAVTFTGLNFDPLPIAVVAVLGSMTHLVLDCLTKSGVRPFAPLWNLTIHGNVTTGNFIIELPITVLCLFVLRTFF